MTVYITHLIFYIILYIILAVPSLLPRCTGFLSLVAGSGGHSSVEVHQLLIAVASLVAKQRL